MGVENEEEERLMKKDERMMKMRGCSWVWWVLKLGFFLSFIYLIKNQVLIVYYSDFF